MINFGKQKRKLHPIAPALCRTPGKGVHSKGKDSEVRRRAHGDLSEAKRGKLIIPCFFWSLKKCGPAVAEGFPPCEKGRQGSLPLDCSRFVIGVSGRRSVPPLLSLATTLGESGCDPRPLPSEHASKKYHQPLFTDQEGPWSGLLGLGPPGDRVDHHKVPPAGLFVQRANKDPG